MSLSQFHENLTDALVAVPTMRCRWMGEHSLHIRHLPSTSTKHVTSASRKCIYMKLFTEVPRLQSEIVKIPNGVLYFILKY
jgi:hypothetical protein